MSQSTWVGGRGGWLVPLAALIASYLPDLGRGFIRDDFAWIAGSRTTGALGWLELLGRDNGFYRPLVSATFALDERLFGLDAYAFGLTNFALVVACSAAVFALGLALGMSRSAALVAATVWALNPHGIGGAILWISGRTALLLVLFAVLAAIAALKGRFVLAAAATFLALLAKEEAVMLPAILAVIVALRPRAGGIAWDREQAARWAAILLIPLAGYLLLRARTDAYLPASAPAFYRPTLDPALLARNVLEYADRSATLAAAVVLLALVVVRRRPRLGPDDRCWIAAGALWLVGGFALTVFLPVRSSLYACFPSVGAALVAATLVSALARQAAPAQLRVLLGLAIMVPILLVPLHRSRNVRLRKTAELSARVLEDVRRARPEIAEGRILVIHDAPGERYNVATAFGTLIEDAVRLRTGIQGARVWVDPPPPGWEGTGLEPPTGQPAVHLRLSGGRLAPAP